MLIRRRVLLPVAVILGLVVPAATAAMASAAGASQSQTVTGQVQEVVIDQAHGAGTPDKVMKVLRVRGRMVPLTSDSLPGVKSGTTVAATVVPAANGTQQVLSSEQVAAAPATPVTASAAISKTVYIALVSPLGYGRDPIQNTTNPAAMVALASSYWGSQTGGQVAFTVARVLPWYGSTHPCSDVLGIWNEALARMPEAAGINKHLIVVSPPAAYQNSGCPYGLGTIGTVSGSGNAVFVSDQNQSLYAHELGHNMGLYHSNSLSCGSAQDGALVALDFVGCQTSPYDDLFDVMGYSGASFGEGDLNAVHLDGMKLLPGAVRSITASSGATTALIAPLSTTTSNRTLKVTDTNGANYFVEYRTDSGRDAVATVNPYHPAWGVRVLRDDPNAPPSAGSYELDATPTGVANDYNRSIPVGGTFTAASGKLTISVTGQDAAGASISVSYGTGPVPVPPPAGAVPSTVTISLPGSARVGATITAATKVTDLSGGAVAGWTVVLQKMQKGTTTWRSVKSLHTTSAGAASYAFLNGGSGSYRWVTAAATGAPAKVSRSVALTSTARVVLRRPATAMTHGRYLYVYGSVSSVPAPVVYIQYRYAGGTWRTGPRATVSGTAVSGRIAMNIRATAYTRLYVRTATSYVGSLSSYFVTSVR